MIDFSNISLQFNGRYLFDNVNLRISSGDKISLVGANGTGKSSLLKIITGELQPESGKIQKQKGISIGYLPQDHVTHQGKTLFEEASAALTDIMLLREKESDLTESLNDSAISVEERDDLIHQLGEVHHRLEDLDSYTAEARVEKILIGLGFIKEDFYRLTDEFSGGWQMRIALSKILISQNDMLLMDEPTNHLDLDSLEWLISYLKNYKGALIIVSHDKHFINEVTDRTLEIYLGKFNSFNGNYDKYLVYKKERDEQTYNQFVQQQKRIKETERFIERFRYKATKAKQVQSRVKQLEKMNLVELPDNQENINVLFPDPPSSGRVNIELKGLKKSYGSNLIFDNFNFVIERGEKIAFVGPNGAGKTTLSKIIAGILDYDRGERILGHNTVISYYAQDVADNLDPDLDILETIENAAGDKTIGQLRGLLGSFLFSGDDVFKKVGILSGGEKSRVALAKILLAKANLIVLDEPTNHLDVSSKEVLQKALVNFPGSLILVSHDVDFLRPIVNKIIEINKEGIKTYLGGIDYYLNKRREDQESQEEIADREKLTSAGTRKDQKRIEAELRQKKYAATKNIIKGIDKVEKEIDALEKRKLELETILAGTEVYENPQKAREVNIEYIQIQKDLEAKLSIWTELSEELHSIEQQFE